ncbi:MAG: prepilin-type N-terminal cleavage/methylation domain-containing protein [bacterium]
MKSNRPVGQAFTLIELLIVVAIIAILAAIAVPNFIEAQTRAKVSRAKNDMRTHSNALQAYFIDYGTYPAAWGPGMISLTSPIAYVSSLPLDPFIDKRLDYDSQWYTFNGRYIQKVCYLDGGGTPQVFEWTNWRNCTPKVAGTRGNWYHLWSWGPDGNNNGTYGFLPYDPTNGTISVGDIIVLGGAVPFDKYYPIYRP